MTYPKGTKLDWHPETQARVPKNGGALLGWTNYFCALWLLKIGLRAINF